MSSQDFDSHDSSPEQDRPGPLGDSSGDWGSPGDWMNGASADFDAWERDSWGEGLTDQQLALQADLSCLVDGELDEPAAARAMVALEESPECRDFFDDLRRFARLHRDMSDPERFEARLVMLGGCEVAKAAEEVDLAHRLATIFYQLGKAYTLAALDRDGFAERVFESAVPVDEAKTRGRGFVDGVVSSGRADAGPAEGSDSEPDTFAFAGGRAPGVDWTGARHLLNGRLERIAGPLEKGRRLLEQAVEVDPSHEEARIYLAYIFSSEGKSLRAADLYRDVFDTGIDVANRGHAAMQLGRMRHREGDMRGALRFWRWMSMVGLDQMDRRFSLVHFNIGLAQLQAGREDVALSSFRRLVDGCLAAETPISDVASLFLENDDARRLLESSEGFVPRLARTIPEVFESYTPPAA